MSYTEDELWSLLAEASNTWDDTADIALLEQIVMHADALRFEQVQFEARMQLTRAYTNGDEPAKSFETFSWCLAEFDRDPEKYADSMPSVLWDFKLMISNLKSFPTIPLARTYSVLDDMQRRFTDGGHSMHAVYTSRHEVAAHIGDLDAAEDFYAKWCAAPRDELSDCIGCDPTNKAAWLTATGRDEEAIALAEPILAGRLPCTEQPQGILTMLLMPYARTGRLALARNAHRRAYRRHQTQLADLAEIGKHIYFCAVTGNETRGLEIVERHIGWLDKAPTPYAAMIFASSAALVLSRHRDAGHGDALVHRTSGDITIAALAKELSTHATDLAAQFDARNGTTYQSGDVAKTLAAVPIGVHVPLGVTTTRAPEAPAAPATSVTPIPPEATADELLDLADHHLLHERTAAVIDVEDAFDERFATFGLSQLQRGRRADIRGLIAANAGDLGVAEIAWTSALDLFTEARDEVRRHATRARLGLLMSQTGRGEVGLPIVQDSTDYLLAHGPVKRHCAAYQRLALAFLMNGRPDDALAALDRAATVADASEDPLIACKLLAHRAGMLADVGQYDEAALAAHEAREASRAAGYRAGIAGMSFVLGRIEQERDDLDAAVAAYDEAISTADEPEFVREIRRQRGSMLAGTSHAADAIDDLSAEVATAAGEGNVDLGRTASYHLANAYLNASRPLDAADLLEELLASLAPEDVAAESVRHMLAQAYRRLDQPDQAIEQLELIAGSGARRSFPPLIGEMNEQIAQILDQLDRDGPAAIRFAAASEVYQQAELSLEAVRTGRRAATSHMWARQLDDAADALHRVDLIALDVPPNSPEVRWERAMLGVDGARILAANDDLEAAIIRCAPAIDTFQALEDGSAAAFARATYGDFLVRAGRAGQAEEPLRAALAGGDGSVQARARQTLIKALEMLGRADEAEELRTQRATEE